MIFQCTDGYEHHLKLLEKYLEMHVQEKQRDNNGTAIYKYLDFDF